MLLRTQRVAIIVSGYDISRAFQTETLGLEIIAEAHRPERRPTRLDLRLPDGSRIELSSFPDPPERPSQPEACGLRHLAFEVADIDRAMDRLRSREVAVEEVRGDEVTGKRSTCFAGPDGLPLELYERRASRPARADGRAPDRKDGMPTSGGGRDEQSPRINQKVDQLLK